MDEVTLNNVLNPLGHITSVRLAVLVGSAVVGSKVDVEDSVAVDFRAVVAVSVEEATLVTVAAWDISPMGSVRERPQMAHPKALVVVEAVGSEALANSMIAAVAVAATASPWATEVGIGTATRTADMADRVTILESGRTTVMVTMSATAPDAGIESFNTFDITAGFTSPRVAKFLGFRR